MGKASWGLIGRGWVQRTRSTSGVKRESHSGTQTHPRLCQLLQALPILQSAVAGGPHSPPCIRSLGPSGTQSGGTEWGCTCTCSAPTGCFPNHTTGSRAGLLEDEHYDWSQKVKITKNRNFGKVLIEASNLTRCSQSDTDPAKQVNILTILTHMLLLYMTKNNMILINEATKEGLMATNPKPLLSRRIWGFHAPVHPPL